MLPLLMPVETWDTINTLCFNRKVLLVGVADGNDVVALAQTAMICAVYAEVDNGDIGVLCTKVREVQELVAARELGSRVLLHSVPSLLGITQYALDQFDVVVYNPGACRDPDPAGTAAMIANYTKRLIVVGDAIGDLWDVILPALPQGKYTASSDGNGIFVTLAAPEPIVRMD